MTKMLSGANLPPIEALMDGDLQEWQRGRRATTLGRRHFISDHIVAAKCIAKWPLPFFNQSFAAPCSMLIYSAEDTGVVERWSPDT